MTQYPHLEKFHTTEGHWQDRNVFRPIIQDLYNKFKIISILEIGFNIGYSASMWLEFDADKKSTLTSVDIGFHADTVKASEAVKNLHGDRFSFILSDSKKVKQQLKGKLFDLAFIDGDHSATGVASDIRLCIDLQIPLLLFDDYWTYSESNQIKKVCDQFVEMKKLSLIRVYDLDLEQPKVALYRNDTIHTEKNTLARQISTLFGNRPKD
tara:strand:+ start:1306 stop:1935 length:630 start_codon:yes stop_codon:yes gene_type:complete